jgi:hypothetical protein
MSDETRDVLEGLEGFTPGPWRMDGNTFVYGLGADRHNRFTAPVQRSHDTPWDEVEANARLIARAPELVEEISKLRYALGDVCEGYDMLAGKVRPTYDNESYPAHRGDFDDMEESVQRARALLPDTPEDR